MYNKSQNCFHGLWGTIWPGHIFLTPLKLVWLHFSLPSPSSALLQLTGPLPWLKHTTSAWPQGLCSGCALCLAHPFLRPPHTHILTSLSLSSNTASSEGPSITTPSQMSPDFSAWFIFLRNTYPPNTVSSIYLCFCASHNVSFMRAETSLPCSLLFPQHLECAWT